MGCGKPNEQLRNLDSNGARKTGQSREGRFIEGKVWQRYKWMLEDWRQKPGLKVGICESQEERDETAVRREWPSLNGNKRA